MFRNLAASIACITTTTVAASAQTAIDRVDPARIERDVLSNPAKPPLPSVIIEGAPLSGASAATGAIDVGAIAIDGLTALQPAEFADIIARSVGRSLSGEDLGKLAGDIAARARSLGYVFASARIEPQRLAMGVLRVSFDEGVIDDVRIEGTGTASASRTLAPLIGKPAILSEVERRLLLVEDIDGVAVRRSRFVREGKRGVLLVEILRTPLRVRAVLENDSTAPIGPEQLRIDADLSALLATDDAFTVTYVTTPLEPSELQYVRGRYTKRVSAEGTEVSVSGSMSSTRPGAYLDSLDLHGRSWSANASVLQPLIRQRAGSLWIRGSLDLRNVEQNRRGLLIRHDRIAAVRVSLYGNQKLFGGLMRVNTTLSQGLDLFDATRFGDPLASRSDADGTFTQLSSWADWTAPLGGDFSVRLAVLSQLSSGPLLVAEEIGIGGSSFLRGYDYSERSGDQGGMASLELRYDWQRPFGLMRKAQLYGFVDGGRVENLSGGFGGGALASGGGGVRADVSSSIDANVEVAVPLTGPRYETGTSDPRFNFRLLKVF